MAGLLCQRCQTGTCHPSKGSLLRNDPTYWAHGRAVRRTIAPIGIRSSVGQSMGVDRAAPESAALPGVPAGVQVRQIC